MLEILGLALTQPDPPALPPEIGFISELKMSIDSSPQHQEFARLANREPEKLIARAKSLCLDPTLGGTQVNPLFQRLAIKWFC